MPEQKEQKVIPIEKISKIIKEVIDVFNKHNLNRSQSKGILVTIWNNDIFTDHFSED